MYGVWTCCPSITVHASGILLAHCGEGHAHIEGGGCQLGMENKGKSGEMTGTGTGTGEEVGRGRRSRELVEVWSLRRRIVVKLGGGLVGDRKLQGTRRMAQEMWLLGAKVSVLSDNEEEVIHKLRGLEERDRKEVGGDQF
ncbi:hypothetical protein VNO78_12908 [Psophocarpus tetragonolobus]|uniref:Uncharacterized protein n=1 Tax=Psophocarpus tetragonolobus TaxID=3891 RepID=A0AAN9SNL5_PSOTE